MAQFNHIDRTTYPPHYTKEVELERLLDEWRAALSGAFCEHVAHSGNIAETLSLAIGGGYRYNDGCDKIITAVTVQCVTSGSGGVTRLDVRKGTAGTNGQLTSDLSIFSNNVFKPILSSSAGDGAVARTTTFVPASASWLRGQYLGVVTEAGAGAAGVATSAQTGVNVRIWWTPSGSY